MKFQNKKNYLILFLLLLLAFLIRIPNQTFPFFGDEAWHDFVKFHKGAILSVEYESMNGENTLLIDPPLTGWFYLAYSSIFGFSTIILRSTSLIFGLINILLIYFLAKKVFNTKTAALSVFLAVISFWHVIESYILDRDGNFLIFFYLLIILLYVFYRETKNKRYLWLGATISVFYMFIKVSGALITAILFLIILYDNKIFQEIWNNKKHIFNLNLYLKSSFKKAFLEIFPFVLANIVSYAVFFAGVYFLNKPFFNSLLAQEAIPLEFFTAEWTLSAGREIIYLIIYGSPLLLGLSVLSLLYFNKKKMLFLFWLLVPIIAYSKIPYAGALERYLSVIIPPLCILGGSFLAELSIYKKGKMLLLGAASILYFILLNILSAIPVKYLSHNISEYALQVTVLKWGFLFPFYGVGGPAFLIPFFILGMSFILCGIFFILVVFFIKRKNIFYFFLILFIAIGLSFNLYIIQELNLAVHTPNIRTGFNQILSELPKEDSTLIYTNIGALKTYDAIEREYVLIKFSQKDKFYLDNILASITEKGGAVYLLDFPKRFENSKVYEIITRNCRLRKEIKDKQVIIGIIYDC